MHDDRRCDRGGQPSQPAMRAAGAAAAPERDGDDLGFCGFSGEPAMVVLPAASPQRMPGMASAGLAPVHPEEQIRPLPVDASELVEVVAGNRPRIAEGPSPGSFRDVELRRVDAGPMPSLEGLDNGEPEGSAWLILPTARPLVPLGNGASEPIRVCLSPRIASAILGMLAEAVNAPERGISAPPAALSEPSDHAGRLDSPDPARPPYVRAAPDRIAGRPRPDQWCDDELLTLPEAARLFWPDGPLTTTSLRTAARDGRLEIRTVAGRHMTTPAAMRRLGLPRSEDAAPGPSVSEAAASMLGRLERRRH